MQAPDRITLVLRPAEGGTLEHVLPFVQLGAHVHVGRGLAVIAGTSEGDLQERMNEQDRRLSIISRKATEFACASMPTGRECRFGDEIAALAHSGTVEKGGTDFDIDDHVKLVADARRYRWLRDQAITTDSGFTPAVYDRAGGIGTVRAGEDLDQRIDSAIRNFTLEQVVQEHQS